MKRLRRGKSRRSIFRARIDPQVRRGWTPLIAFHDFDNDLGLGRCWSPHH